MSNELDQQRDSRSAASRCDVHVFSMHLAGERLWTVVVRGGDDRVRFDRTEPSLRQAVRDALTEAERRGMIGPGPEA